MIERISLLTFSENFAKIYILYLREEIKVKNVFTSCILSKKPNSLKECMKMDHISASLWAWCETIETIGKIVCWVIGIIGIITAFALAEDGGFRVFITIIAITAALAFFQYITYHLIAIILGAGASIVHNVRITAGTALYCAENDGEVQGEKSTKSSDKSVVRQRTTDTASPLNCYDAGYWTCQKCKSKNGAGNQYCKNCGEYK